MKKLIISLTMIFFCIFFTATSLQAQQEITAKKYENAKWKRITLIKFKAGKYPRAKEISKNYFSKAGQKAGTTLPIIMDIMNGEWDRIMIFDMKGVEEMNWEITPDSAKWMNALNEVAGGADKAKAIRDEYFSLIEKSTTYLAKE